MINIVSFGIFDKLDVSCAIQKHFQKWSKVTVEDNDETIYTKIYKGPGNEIKNSKFSTVMREYKWQQLIKH